MFSWRSFLKYVSSYELFFIAQKRSYVLNGDMLARGEADLENVRLLIRNRTFCMKSRIDSEIVRTAVAESDSVYG